MIVVGYITRYIGGYHNPWTGNSSLNQDMTKCFEHCPCVLSHLLQIGRKSRTHIPNPYIRLLLKFKKYPHEILYPRQMGVYTSNLTLFIVNPCFQKSLQQLPTPIELQLLFAKSQ